MSDVEAKRASAKAEHRKELLDPLLSMQRYMEAKKKSDDLSGREGAMSTLTVHSQVYQSRT